MNIIDYLETSTLVANIISFIMLGIVGVVLTSIVSAFGEIKQTKSELDQLKSEYTQRRLLADMSYYSARLYKNAILNSSMTADGKIMASTDFLPVEQAYLALKAIEEPVVGGDAIDNGVAESLIDVVREEAVELMVDTGASLLDNLRDEIKKTNI